MVIRPRMDHALHYDGGGRVAGVAAQRFAGFVLYAVGTELRMVAALLRPALAGIGTRGYCGAVDYDFADAAGFLESGPQSWLADGALSRLGEFCERAKREYLVVELRDLIRPFGAPSPEEKGEVQHCPKLFHASPLEKLSQSD